jgi:hypothetical protein
MSDDILPNYGPQCHPLPCLAQTSRFVTLKLGVG